MLKITPSLGKTIEWYPGDENPLIVFPIHRVESTGSTTEFILRTFSGLPFRGFAPERCGEGISNFSNRQVWSGDFAQFIVDNL